jgi:FkbM family methyltransferase
LAVKKIKGMWFPDHDEHFAAQLAGGPVVDGKGTYQFKKYQRALPYVANRGHTLDVGAHVGLWSRVMALDFETVTAIEPMSDLRDCFVRNVPETVRLLPCAVGSKRGKARIGFPSDNSGNARVAEFEGKTFEQTEAPEVVEVVTIDSLALPHIDFMKIDVEGFEFDVITGAEQTIRKHRPVMIVEQKPSQAERYGRGRWDAVKLLQSWGMRQEAEFGGDHVMVWR